MNRLKIHIGLRTVKTAIAVTLALALAQAMGSSMPIFAAIGAIVAMSRTLGDALSACLTEFAGTLCGCIVGVLFVTLLPAQRPAIIGLGIVLVITVTIALKLQFAVPLASIVFVSICLHTSGSVLTYAAQRFMDTSVGLLVALAVNMLIRPYNNRERIAKVMTHFVEAMPDYLRERVLLGLYPDLTPLRRCLDLLDEEISLYERQTFPGKRTRKQAAVYLRGCQQLAERIYDELKTLCMMDSPGTPKAGHRERLAALGITAVSSAALRSSPVEDAVLGYHLDNLLTAFSFLCTMRDAPDDGKTD